MLFGQVGCESLGGRPVGFAVPAGCVTEIADTPTGTAVPAATSRRVVFVCTPRRETVGLLAGTGVKVLPQPLPHLPTRRQLRVHANRVMGVFDLSDVTIVIPNLARLAAT